MKPRPSGESPRGTSPLRVLFVDDDLDDVALSLEVLKSSEFEVASHVVDTPDAFLESVRAHRYDVILSDFNMPTASGMAIFELLQQEGLDTPFILVTGALGDEKAVECVRAGMADFVLKDRLARLPVAIRQAIEVQERKIEHAQAEQALRRSEESYRSLIQSAPCGILRFNAREGNLLDANRALSEMLGYQSAADLVDNAADGGIALDAESILRLVYSDGPGRPVVETDIEWKRKDGMSLNVLLRGRVLRNDDGDPASIEMIAENVTERRSAQKRIEHLNRLYRVLSDAGQATVRIRDERELFREVCRILTVEGGFQMAWIGMVDSCTGRVTPVTSCPRGAEDYVSRLDITIHDIPAGRGPVGTAIRESRNVICNDLVLDPSMLPWRESAEDWGYRALGAFPLVVNGRAIGAIAIYAGQIDFFDDENVALLDELANDLSFALERMEVERMRDSAVDELNQFFAVSLDMLCVASLDGYIHRLNPAWERILGFSPVEMCSKPWFEFVHPEDRTRAELSFKNFQAGVEIDHLELRFLSKSGVYHWFLGSAVPSLDRGLVFAAVSDITERKQLEEQLRSQNLSLEAQNRRLNEASRHKSEFLANMSHELRSPLNGIIGFTELLYDGKAGALPDKPREFLNRIHSSAQHLLELISGVLDLSKIEAGHLEFTPERVSVSTLINEVTGILDALVVQKQIDVKVEIDHRVDDVTTDPGRFKQVLYNYLSNAIKFTGPGGKVTVRLKSEGDHAFRLEVSDTGVGIAEKDLPRLFVEFEQLDATKGKRYQGTGLGLAVTKRIVEAQGGRVGVESKMGHGSTFFAILPLVPIPNYDPTLAVSQTAKECDLVPLA